MAEHYSRWQREGNPLAGSCTDRPDQAPDAANTDTCGRAGTRAHARWHFLSLVAATPDARRDLKVLSDAGVEQAVSQQEVHEALRAAIA